MDIPRITPEGAKERVDAGERVVFVDARSAEAYAKASERIPGSIRVPPADADRRAADLARTGAMIVAYCTSRQESSSARVVLALERAGYGNAFALLGGFDAWRDAGFPIEPLDSHAAHAPTP